MKNFKEIAEKCLSGELKGTFKNRKGESISSEVLCRNSNQVYPYAYYSVPWVCVTIHGDFFKSGKFSKYDIIDFIPDNMQKKIEIDIPEGKVPVMEQTEKGIVITWKEKELTYSEIYSNLADKAQQISTNRCCTTYNSSQFYKKVEVLLKLINIRNYFGKPKNTENGFYINMLHEEVPGNYPSMYASNIVAFAKREHAEQAIKMLGDELKYLFEPW